MHVLVVAIVFPSPGNPIPGNFIGQQVLALAERVERITVLSPAPMMPHFMPKFGRFAAKVPLPERYILVPDRCEVLFPRYLKAPGNLFLSWTKMQWCRLVDKTIARFTHSYPVSIIHAHTGSVSSWASIQAAKRHKIPCVVTYHGSEVHTALAGRQQGWELCRDSFGAADLNLPVSRALEAILRSSTQPVGRCETLLLGVDRRRFFPALELALEPQVLYVGRIERAKGVYDLLDAWVRVLAHCPDARLTLIGEDRTGGSVHRQVQSLGINESVILTGPLSGHQVADMMRRSRIFCLPSHNEGTPVCIMEALSCGLPVVATRVGGIPDVVEHEKTGLLVAKGNVQGVADALLSLFRDPSRCVQMGKEARAFADTHLDIARTANRLVDLYRATMGNHELSEH
ncbi:MAG: glycosyltransferase [Nitrospira sp.]|nr:glycosyltransferase [Nitrospira sp.]